MLTATMVVLAVSHGHAAPHCGVATTSPCDLFATNVNDSPTDAWSCQDIPVVANQDGNGCDDGGYPDSDCSCDYSPFDCTRRHGNHAREIDDAANPSFYLRGVSMENLPAMFSNPNVKITAVRANVAARYSESAGNQRRVQLWVKGGNVGQGICSESTAAVDAACPTSDSNVWPSQGPDGSFCGWPVWGGEPDGFLIPDHSAGWTPTEVGNLQLWARSFNASDQLRIKEFRLRVFFSTCGNGMVEAGEQCDGGPCCSSTCTFLAPGTACSDGLFCDGTEACDGTGQCVSSGNDPCNGGCCDENTDRCCPTMTPTPTVTNATLTPTPSDTPVSPTATPSPTRTVTFTPTPAATPMPCGNGILDPGEECDDGNLEAGDGCDPTCRHETRVCCGTPNRVCNTDDACPPGDTCCVGHCDLDLDTSGCDARGPSCSSSAQCDPASSCCTACGNGFREPGEECDDDNTQSYDGCSATCQIEGVCTLDPQRRCVHDPDCPPGAGSCCGDAVVSGDEECDDGNQIDDDGCTNACKLGAGVPACPGFRGADVVQATVKQTKLADHDLNGVLEQWSTNASVILSATQALGFDPERQLVQVRFAERDGAGGRRELWQSGFILPDGCTPNVFCFPRLGRPTRFTWKKVSDNFETFSPGVRSGRFTQSDNAIKVIKLDGRRAAIQAPSDTIGTSIVDFLVRQEVIVDGLCMTVQLQCEKHGNGKLYKCVPGLVH